MKGPVFVSLVGTSEEGNEVFDKLSVIVPDEFRNLRCSVLESPFKDYSDLKIGDKRKRDYSPSSRLLFRWAFFNEYNQTVVVPAFKSSDIVIVRNFGFDLYEGAVAHQECEIALKLHESLVPYGVVGLGLCPPAYVFADQVSSKTRAHMARYFKPPQRTPVELNPNLYPADKVMQIVNIIHKELRGARIAAA